jgi:hypothetical protein
MRWLSVLAWICLVGGAGLTIGSFIAIFITSGTLTALIIAQRALLWWIPLLKALGVEALILVLGVAMYYVGIHLAWRW